MYRPQGLALVLQGVGASEIYTLTLEVDVYLFLQTLIVCLRALTSDSHSVCLLALKVTLTVCLLALKVDSHSVLACSQSGFSQCACLLSK